MFLIVYTSLGATSSPCLYFGEVAGLNENFSGLKTTINSIIQQSYNTTMDLNQQSNFTQETENWLNKLKVALE